MSRTRKLITGSEFYATRTLDSLVPDKGGQGIQKVSNTPEDDQRYIDMVMPHVSADGRMGYKPIPVVVEQAILFLKEKYPRYSNAFLDALKTILSRGRSSRAPGEQTFFSRMVVNEFLATDAHKEIRDGKKYKNFGEFLDDKWDELYDRAANFDITEYQWTIEVYQEVREGALLALRPGATKAALRTIENLTTDNVREIIAASKKLVPYSYFSNKDVSPKIVEIIQKSLGKVPTAISANHLTNILLRALSQSLENRSDADRDHMKIGKTFQDILIYLRERISVENLGISDEVLFSGELETLCNFLLKNAASFNGYEMFFFVRTLTDPAQMGRGATSKDVLDFHLAYIKAHPDEAVEMFREIGEMGILYNRNAPLFSEWTKALAAGNLKNLISMDFTLALLSGGTREIKPKRELDMVRKVFASI